MTAACRQRQAVIRAGSQVAVEYTLYVDGEKRETNAAGEPRRFVSGSGDILRGLDQELQGLTVGAVKSVELPPEKAYGLRDEASVRSEPRKAFEGLGAELKPGLVIKGALDGQAAEARILSVGGETLRLDFNHPLAGKTLRFDVRVVSVE